LHGNTVSQKGAPLQNKHSRTLQKEPKRLLLGFFEAEKKPKPLDLKNDSDFGATGSGFADSMGERAE